MARLTPTAAQTLGPFFSYGFLTEEDSIIAGPTAIGRHIKLVGMLTNRDGNVCRDALIEIWQADAAGLYKGRDADADPAVKGFGRTLTDENGSFEFQTILPGACPGPGNSWQAPHFAVGLFAGGLTRRVVTRIYTPDHPELEEDQVLTELGNEAARTLIARWVSKNTLEFNIRLAGEGATAFLQD